MSQPLSEIPPPSDRAIRDAAQRPPAVGSPPSGLDRTESDDNSLKGIPPTKNIRRRIREAVDQRIKGCQIKCSLPRDEIKRIAQEALCDLRQTNDYLAWTMVAVGSAHWRPRVMAVPFDKRLVLLPHCMRDSKYCPASYNEFGLQCKSCGACPLAKLKSRAEELGCHVLIAEGSPIVMQLIVSGQADAVLGVGCLNSLEKSFDKLTTAGVPGCAVPLHSCECVDTHTDLDAVIDMLETPFRPRRGSSNTRLDLLRSAHALFEIDTFCRLIPPLREEVVPLLNEHEGRNYGSIDLSGVSPIAATELLAYDFLLQGGKHFRPFITLAAYATMGDGQSAQADHFDSVSDSVRRIAMAIEIFHKASLVHDDIEDNDAYRYGRETLHRTHGVSTAINVGDYLIGLGYRVVASQHHFLPSKVVAEISARLGLAHTQLSEGQGAELAWRTKSDKRILPIDALKIYALKTAPAFEVALFAGLRMGGPIDEYEKAISRFSRHLGVAFQILNDLDDWTPNAGNKRVHGGDILGGRPTVLLALALQSLGTAEQEGLLSIVGDGPQRCSRCSSNEAIDRVAVFYEKARVRRTASELIVKNAARARKTAASIDHASLRDLLEYLVDMIVGR